MRTLPNPGFDGDDGAAAPAVTQALVAYDADPEQAYDATLAVLQEARVLVPVVAVLGEVEQGADGLDRDKSADMATVLMQGRDGRQALLAFTGTEAMARWDAAARPVPVTLARAAEAAVQDGAAALLLDVAGPVLLVVETDDLRALAAGERLVAVGDRFGWVRPAEG